MIIDTELLRQAIENIRSNSIPKNASMRQTIISKNMFLRARFAIEEISQVLDGVNNVSVEYAKLLKERRLQ